MLSAAGDPLGGSHSPRCPQNPPCRPHTHSIKAFPFSILPVDVLGHLGSITPYSTLPSPAQGDGTMAPEASHLLLALLVLLAAGEETVEGAKGGKDRCDGVEGIGEQVKCWRPRAMWGQVWGEGMSHHSARPEGLFFRFLETETRGVVDSEEAGGAETLQELQVLKQNRTFV